MRYAQIREMDISNGLGIGIALFTQGCPYHCKNCFNKETWDFDSGCEWTQKDEDKIIDLLEPEYISRLTILGGEPLIDRNKKSLNKLLKRVKELYKNKKIWLYTGAEFEKIKDEYIDILKYVDVVIDGRFVDELKDNNLKFRGSSNQRIIDVQQSLLNKDIIYYNISAR